MSDKIKLVKDPQHHFEALQKVSSLLNTGVDGEALAICVRLCEAGVKPEVVASIVAMLSKEGNKAAQAKVESLDVDSSAEFQQINQRLPKVESLNDFQSLKERVPKGGLLKGAKGKVVPLKNTRATLKFLNYTGSNLETLMEAEKENLESD